MECRKYKNPYDMYIRHYAMRAWTKSVVTKVTWLHQSGCDFDFSDGFFSFSPFHSGHVPDHVAPRETSIALLLSRYCAGGPILNSGLKILIPTKTTRKAATNRFVVSPCVLDCIKGGYVGVFRELNFNHVTLNFNFNEFY